MKIDNKSKGSSALVKTKQQINNMDLNKEELANLSRFTEMIENAFSYMTKNKTVFKKKLNRDITHTKVTARKDVNAYQLARKAKKEYIKQLELKYSVKK